MKYFILASQEFLCTIIIHVDLQFSRQQLSGTSVLCSKMLFTYIHIPIEEISFYSILSILWNSCVYMYESLSTWYCHNKHFFFPTTLCVVITALFPLSQLLPFKSLFEILKYKKTAVSAHVFYYCIRVYRVCVYL